MQLLGWTSETGHTLHDIHSWPCKQKKQNRKIKSPWTCSEQLIIEIWAANHWEQCSYHFKHQTNSNIVSLWTIYKIIGERLTVSLLSNTAVDSKTTTCSEDQLCWKTMFHVVALTYRTEAPLARTWSFYNIGQHLWLVWLCKWNIYIYSLCIKFNILKYYKKLKNVWQEQHDQWMSLSKRTTTDTVLLKKGGVLIYISGVANAF